MKLKRLIYLAYYLKGLDKPKVKKFVNFVVEQKQISKTKLYLDVLKSSLSYNISILDYFYFRFYNLNDSERSKYAGTGYMYEYQLKMNPKNSRDILENKFKFLKTYSNFVLHDFTNKTDFLGNESIQNRLLSNKSKKIISKSSDGQCGDGVEVLSLEKLSKEEIIDRVKNSGNDLVEEFIIQHDDIMKLSPSGLNTVRIFTQLDKENNVCILGARLRLTIDTFVDNLAAGNIAVPIDDKTGIINGVGVYSDITKKDEEIHPITKETINGFQIPYWKESIKMVKEAALLRPENKSIGWDIAITNNGPELLEGNHNWCKLLWQLPVKKGMKIELEKHL